MDAWAHHHLDSSLETFFTPWHAIFYSGFLVLAITIGWKWLSGVRQKYQWYAALPRGYGLSLLGAVIFMAGGVGDLLWHIIFGIEVDIEALLSPTHLILALGAALIVAGPLRASVFSHNQFDSWFQELPMVCALIFFTAVLAFMTQYAHPLVNPWMGLVKKTDDPFFGQALGTLNILIHTAIIMGVVLAVLRRRVLPVGSFTLLFGLHAVAFTILENQFRFLLPAVVSGILIDYIYWRVRSSFNDSFQFRVFAFVVPFIYYFGYFITIAATEGTWWSVHLWAGMIVLAGVVGWLLSHLVFPSAQDDVTV